MFFLQNPLIIGSMLHVECVFFWFMLLDASWVLRVCHTRCRWGLSMKINHKMGLLTGLHDFYDSWHLYIRRFVIISLMNQPTVVANSSNHCRARRHNISDHDRLATAGHIVKSQELNWFLGTAETNLRDHGFFHQLDEVDFSGNSIVHSNTPYIRLLYFNFQQQCFYSVVLLLLFTDHNYYSNYFNYY